MERFACTAVFLHKVTTLQDRNEWRVLLPVIGGLHTARETRGRWQESRTHNRASKIIPGNFYSALILWGFPLVRLSILLSTVFSALRQTWLTGVFWNDCADSVITGFFVFEASTAIKSHHNKKHMKQIDGVRNRENVRQKSRTTRNTTRTKLFLHV